MEFCTEKELVAQTGHQSYEWLRVIVKELVDNGIDACEEAEIAPVIKVTITTGTVRNADAHQSSKTTVPAFRRTRSPELSTTTFASPRAKPTSRQLVAVKATP